MGDSLVVLTLIWCNHCLINGLFLGELQHTAHTSLTVSMIISLSPFLSCTSDPNLRLARTKIALHFAENL